MMAIKPGLCSICCHSYNKQMIYDYLRDIKYRNSDNPSTSTSKVLPSKTQTPDALQSPPDSESVISSEEEDASSRSGSEGKKSRKGEESDKAPEPVDYSPGPRLRP